MDIEVGYGSETIRLHLPDSMTVDRYAPSPGDRRSSAGRLEAEIMQNGGSDWLESDGLLIVVNDGHRNSPTAVLLSWLDEIKPGLLDKSRFLIATGTHKPPTDQHHIKIFGDLWPRIKDRVDYHVATEYETMINVGIDRFGGDVWINGRFLDAGKVLAINSVEPHYFAGYTGGRKSLFPGLADLATIERNHNLANSLECRPMRFDGNPMSEHLDELVDLIDTSKVFTIQAVSTSPSDIVDVKCGGIKDAFRRAVATAEPIFSKKADAPYDLLIAEVWPPLDATLYQIQKAIENTQMAVADGGSAVLVSRCHDGVGSDHFFELADSWDVESNQPSDGRQRFGSHKLSRVIDMQKRIGVWVYSELKASQVEKVYYRALADVQQVIDRLASEKPDARVAVVHDAGNMVLTV